jgi:glycosyltransferase involved in cell wall biosynthesis
MERIVLAPGITGIPEIVHHGKTGFLYQPDSMEDFLTKLQIVIHARELLTEIQRNARKHVEQHFNASLTLPQFVTSFLSQIDASQPPGPEALREKAHENPVLQQI